MISGNKLVIKVESSLGSDGFSAFVLDKDNEEVFKKSYRYGYTASHDKMFAKEGAPYTGDVVSILCHTYGVDKKDVVVEAGENVFAGKPVSEEKVQNFKEKYL